MGFKLHTFDSTGTQVTGESVGTGNGTTATFTYTLAHTPVSPFSVLFSVGGTAEIGDCPWFTNTGGTKYCMTTTANLGTLGSPIVNVISQSTSTINYSTGAVTINFVTAPAVGVAITVNYIYGGWNAGGTGLMDENGSHTAWVGTNLFCLEGPDPSYPTYFTCVGGGAAAQPCTRREPATWRGLGQLDSGIFSTIFQDHARRLQDRIKGAVSWIGLIRFLGRSGVQQVHCKGQLHTLTVPL